MIVGSIYFITVVATYDIHLSYGYPLLTLHKCLVKQTRNQVNVFIYLIQKRTLPQLQLPIGMQSLATA